jgi:hypothetical protein
VGPILSGLSQTTYKICYVKSTWGKLWRTVDECPKALCMWLVCNVILRMWTSLRTGL